MLHINEILFESRFRLFLLGAFIFISVLAAIDIIADIQEGTGVLHIIVETIVFKAGKVWGHDKRNFALVQFNQKSSVY